MIDPVRQAMLQQKPPENRQTIQDPKPRFPPWLITYSDLITLLLTFFVLMMSMADLDPVRFNAASNSLKGAFGIRPTKSDSSPTAFSPAPPILQTEPIESHIINSLYKKLNLEFEDQLRSEKTAIMRINSDTILVRIPEPLLFEPGRHQLNEDSTAFIDTIAEAIAEHPIYMRVEGHCDAFEPADATDNGFELSTARAVSVVRHLIQKNILDADRLSAIGYGNTKPITDTSNPSEQSLNRRVDIFLRADFLSGTGSATNDRRKVPL